ncbi:hypothetical protein [Asticcacaulis sp.]|uniref:hypothetical protein n=1 Tax=Asticcacaulis sp. TaxID=1872648 RepID=UPI003F7C3F93
MSPPKLLIDTNVFIGLEDPREVPANFALLTNLAAKFHVGIYVHEAARDDIAQDKNKERRAISLSKVNKFPLIAKVQGLTKSSLESDFGPLPKHNDIVDATLLHALRLGVIDFLVTQDKGLHDRARNYAPALSRQVLYVVDAVSWLRATYEDVIVPLRYVDEVEAHTIPLANPIFDSLREGYPAFDGWWQTKCVREMRKCWTVSDPDLAGIVVRKEETVQDTKATLPGQKILKVCTFKVRPESRGTKLGELLLRQVLWYSQANNFDVVYLTTFPEQQALIDLVEYYGFQNTTTAADGEMTYERAMTPGHPAFVPDKSLFDVARTNYPAFYSGPKVQACVIPIQEGYHDILFPELKRVPQLDLFGLDGGGSGPRRPGNTIRKVYLCRSPKVLTQPGTVLIFYKGSSHYSPSQALTTVGIFEDITLATSTAELMRMTGGRSVYSERDLTAWNATQSSPVKVINFLLAGHIVPPFPLQEFVNAGIFSSHPQSITTLPQEHLSTILERLSLTLEE